MLKTKIFAAYLPQYHEIPENNEFWGEGFTDWIGVLHATPQFENHKQPRVPLNQNYYDLSKPEVIRWQSELARKYCVGFNIYHYWFKNGHKVLEKPAELLLENKDIDITYFFSWDNSSWIRSWSNIRGNAWAPAFDSSRQQGILLELDYGNESDWKQHFEYLLPFFQDDRYFKICGKPVFALMATSNYEVLIRMRIFWDKLAREHGFSGIFIITGTRIAFNRNVLDAQFVYQPRIASWGRRETIERLLQKYLKINLPPQDRYVKYCYDYSEVWKRIIKHAEKNIKNTDLYFGSFVRYDDTPRRGKNFCIIINETPELFKQYFGQLYKLCCEHDKEFLFLTAWNEWGEGAYLEPDEENGYAYLEAVKRVVDSF